MNRPCSKSRWYITPSLLILWLLPALAGAEVGLRSFTATYSLYQGGMHVANTEISLGREGEFWYWRTTTKARGIYAFFTDKQPYSETKFSSQNGDVRLQQITITDGANRKKDESASFDWDQGKIDVLRKGKKNQLEFADGVYDFQSIHVLASIMNRQRVTKKTVDFYRKGNLVKSRMLFGGKGHVAIDGKNIDANIYEQIITRSDIKMRYYYDAENPLLPLRIEKLEAGDSPSILTLQKVDWIL